MKKIKIKIKVKILTKKIRVYLIQQTMKDLFFFFLRKILLFLYQYLKVEALMKKIKQKKKKN